MKEEKRFFAGRLTVSRSAAGGDGGDSPRVISGYAIRFNEESLLMKSWRGKFVEVIAPEAVTEEWLRTQDVKLTLFHNREKLLARSNKGAGTLRLSVDAQGVRFEFDVPDNEVGRYALEAVERGDLAGCSFTFIPKDYDVVEVDEETTRITHRKFEWLGEMTIDSDPAYPTTEVEARSFLDQLVGSGKEEPGSGKDADLFEERSRACRVAAASLLASDY